MPWLQARRIYLVLYAIGLLAFGAVAGARLARQSPDPHFVYQADAWLNGRLAIDPRPPKGDDWAIVEAVELDDGSRARGRRMVTQRSFMTLGGEEIPRARIRRSLGKTYYVSFPPAPAVAMMPSALLGGRNGNDVVPTVLIAALVLPLFFACYRRLGDVGITTGAASEGLWLTGAFAFGSIFFFAAVQGRVWFTAHVVGVAASLGFIYCALGARRPVLAGLCLAAAALSRVPMAFLFPLLVFEAWRVHRGNLRKLLGVCISFAIPVACLAIVAMAFNYARWGDPLEFGHRFLHVRQQQAMETHGLFSPAYLTRNLKTALTLLPSFSSQAPYVTISGHGLAFWLTSPILLWLLVRSRRSSFHRSVWIVVAVVALPTLFYQNTGWVQFGYRFALDYLALLFLLLAATDRPLGTIAKAAITIGLVINLFGAITFSRYHGFYRTDAATYRGIGGP